MARLIAGIDDSPKYFQYFINKVNDDVFLTLERIRDQHVAFIETLSEAQLMHRYQPEKWSIKEVIGHCIDTERVFVYRLHAFSRKEEQNLAGFDENEYIKTSNYDLLEKEDLTHLYRTNRQSTMAFCKTLTPQMWERSGVANDSLFVNRAIPYIIAGHEMHHFEFIRKTYL